MHELIIQTINHLIDSGVCATYRAIANHIGPQEGDSLGAALWDMVLDDTIVLSDGEYWIANIEDGGFVPQPHWGEWMDAALTGMNRNGDPAGIENPAIPTGRRCSTTDYDNIMIASMMQGRITANAVTRDRKIRKRYKRGD